MKNFFLLINTKHFLHLHVFFRDTCHNHWNQSDLVWAFLGPSWNQRLWSDFGVGFYPLLLFPMPHTSPLIFSGNKRNLKLTKLYLFYSENENVVCITEPIAPTDSSLNRPLNVTMRWIELNLVQELEETFTYLPDPEITGIHPNTTTVRYILWWHKQWGF